MTYIFANTVAQHVARCGILFLAVLVIVYGASVSAVAENNASDHPRHATELLKAGQLPEQTLKSAPSAGTGISIEADNDLAILQSLDRLLNYTGATWKSTQRKIGGATADEPRTSGAAPARSLPRWLKLWDAGGKKPRAKEAAEPDIEDELMAVLERRVKARAARQAFTRSFDIRFADEVASVVVALDAPPQHYVTFAGNGPFEASVESMESHGVRVSAGDVNLDSVFAVPAAKPVGHRTGQAGGFPMDDTQAEVVRSGRVAPSNQRIVSVTRNGPIPVAGPASSPRRPNDMRYMGDFECLDVVCLTQNVV